jgi:hypothetical protein
MIRLQVPLLMLQQRFLLILIVYEMSTAIHVQHHPVHSFGWYGGNNDATVRRQRISTAFPLYHSNGVAPKNTSARRWNGNYKHVSKKFADMRKSKKLWLNLTANGVTKTLQKKRMESLQHVLTKAVIWKLYMDEYPNLEIEYDIGDPDYLPDVVSLGPISNSDNYTQNDKREPIFWGESGRMKVHKALDLMQRYPCAHIVHCRWGVDISAFSDPLIEYIQNEVEEGRLEDPCSWWKGQFLFASLPLDVWRFFDEDTGTILITKNDLEWRDLSLSLRVSEHGSSSQDPRPE